MNYSRAEKLLSKTFSEVKKRHSDAGLRYIRMHWWRYVYIVSNLPSLSPRCSVLEIGASVLSSLIKRRFGCEVHTIHHELESEWNEIYVHENICCHPCELLRDNLPVDDSSFDLILFNDVLEHIPLHPHFLIKQILAKLKHDGDLILSVPNFAASQKRFRLLVGKNPQEPMHSRFVYYAHHREPVMKECLDMINQCGGKVIEKHWYDCDKKETLSRKPSYFIRCLWHGMIHDILHWLFPSLRSHIFIRARINESFSYTPSRIIPPLVQTTEFGRN